jgi:hypothetical protein
MKKHKPIPENILYITTKQPQNNPDFKFVNNFPEPIPKLIKKLVFDCFEAF